MKGRQMEGNGGIGSSFPHMGSCWRHQMETFCALLALCAGNSPVTGEFLSHSHKGQWRGALKFSLIGAWMNGWGWWFETPSHSLWSHCYVISCNMTSSLFGARKVCSYYQIEFRMFLRDYLSLAKTTYMQLSGVYRIVAYSLFYIDGNKLNKLN